MVYNLFTGNNYWAYPIKQEVKKKMFNLKQDYGCLLCKQKCTRQWGS